MKKSNIYTMVMLACMTLGFALTAKAQFSSSNEVYCYQYVKTVEDGVTSYNPNYGAATYYYKLTKKKVNGVISEKVSGGQFITIIKDGCYESDSKGFSVNHGKIKYNSTENGYLLYYGPTYYGDNTIVQFKSDYSSFNVKTMNGDVYVYKRATPPAGVTTCSLIRKPTPSSGSGSGGGYVPPAYPQTTYPSTTYPTTTSSSSSSSSSPSSQPATTSPAKRECIRCHGSGRQEYEGVTFGLDTKYCSECRKTVPSGHYHGPCQLCNGKGYY